MTQQQIRQYLTQYETRRSRTMVIVDFSNVVKWQETLGWQIGVRNLGQLVKHFSLGDKSLRRFYYGSDFGEREASQELSYWSKGMLEMARMSGFAINTKRVKYIHDDRAATGFIAKCDLDVEMTVDLIKERDNYDTMVIFSGDGDLSYVIKYLVKDFNKKCIAVGARGHIGREIIDAKNEGVIETLFYADDFESRLKRS